MIVILIIIYNNNAHICTRCFVDLLPCACHMYVLYKHHCVVVWVVCLLRLRTSGSLPRSKGMSTAWFRSEWMPVRLVKIILVESVRSGHDENEIVKDHPYKPCRILTDKNLQAAWWVLQQKPTAKVPAGGRCGPTRDHHTGILLSTSATRSCCDFCFFFLARNGLSWEKLWETSDLYVSTMIQHDSTNMDWKSENRL